MSDLIIGKLSFGGQRGPQGEIGPTGATGAQGPTGATGEVGAIGPTGEQGIQGVMGPTGEMGPNDVYIGTTEPSEEYNVWINPEGGSSSIIGPTGPAGADGAMGPTGAQGEKGEDGATGPTGAQGETGAQGPTGATGETGAQGPTGADGADGAQGPTGAKGDRGEDGEINLFAYSDIIDVWGTGVKTVYSKGSGVHFSLNGFARNWLSSKGTESFYEEAADHNSATFYHLVHLQNVTDFSIDTEINYRTWFRFYGPADFGSGTGSNTLEYSSITFTPTSDITYDGVTYTNCYTGSGTDPRSRCTGIEVGVNSTDVAHPTVLVIVHWGQSCLEYYEPAGGNIPYYRLAPEFTEAVKLTDNNFNVPYTTTTFNQINPAYIPLSVTGTSPTGTSIGQITFGTNTYTFNVPDTIVGPTGPAGANGADGAQGPTGAQGEVGPTGPAGSGAELTAGLGIVIGPTGVISEQVPVTKEVVPDTTFTWTTFSTTGYWNYYAQDITDFETFFINSGYPTTLTWRVVYSYNGTDYDETKTLTTVGSYNTYFDNSSTGMSGINRLTIDSAGVYGVCTNTASSVVITSISITVPGYTSYPNKLPPYAYSVDLTDFDINSSEELTLRGVKLYGVMNNGSRSSDYGIAISNETSNSVGVNSLAVGQSNTSQGKSLAVGHGNNITSSNGFAVGQSNTVTGSNIGNAIGYSNTVDGDCALAIGGSNTVAGARSYAIGDHLNSHQGQLVIGKYNVEDSNSTYAFIIGNGTSSSAKSNAMTVDTSGNITANNIPAQPSNDGNYVLKCSVSSGVATYTWELQA